MANELLNKILAEVSQLSPTELSLLMEAGEVMKKAAMKDRLCVDDNFPPDIDSDGLCLEDE